MAERAGFEPAVRCYSYDGLANRSFRPLRHLSAWNDKCNITPPSINASSKIKNISNFDYSVDNLLDYYNGTFQSKKNYSHGKFRDKNGEFSTTWFLPSTDVTTSVETYRIAFYYCTEYTTDKDSVGIWSMYIIKKKDDITPEYAYGGDGLWTPGINIGKVYIENENNDKILIAR